ncbi:FYVE-domain-containing protein [Phanerochaete sordida]|uniref:FYVE-domain-containing protein n=1 Tax=Phanerochaete sordida TaxID=48140 RepID=A0A9P3GG16_9APHY|nr:FYVE-domain-containing protein [Phanerochaete sordida]
MSHIVSRLSGLSPPRHESTDSDSVLSAQDTFPSAACSSAHAYDTRSVLSDSAIASSPCETPSIPFRPTGLRSKEHLAVLLRRDLWKPDSQASRCDTFLCSKKFSIFERKHHCRKCGGIFCSACSTRSTLLLDVSNLPFNYPPRGVSIQAFDAPESPVVVARVCDECYDQIHGTQTSRSTLLKQRSQSLQWEVDSASSSSTSSSPRTPPTPLDGSGVLPMPIRRPLLRAHTSPRVPTLSRPPSPPPGVSQELAAYPLCHASAVCKANGGGRWEPKPAVQIVGPRLPGVKAAYELEMEREDEELRRAKTNPIIRDGDFQLRAPREFEPRSLGGPITLSTF